MNNLLEFIDGDLEKITESNEILEEIHHYKVPGGWIVYRDQVFFRKSTDTIHSSTSTAVFVADPNHEWKIE